MKRISALTCVAVAAAGSLLLSAVAASASSGPATVVAKSGQYESVVTCPHFSSGLQPVLSLPYTPSKDPATKPAERKSAPKAAPYDTLVTCTVTFLRQTAVPRDAPVHADPGLSVGPAASAISKACAHASAMRPLSALGPNSCCAASRSSKGRTTMYSCCGPAKSPGGRVSYVCCTTPRSGHLHGRMLYACCENLHAVAAFMPSCVVLDTGFGGMAAQVARHQPYTRTERTAKRHTTRR